MNPAISESLMITCSNCNKVHFIQAGKPALYCIKHFNFSTYKRLRTRGNPDTSQSQNKEWCIFSYLGGEKRKKDMEVFPITLPASVGPLQGWSCLTTDFGEHLVNGLLDVCGGAASPGLALDHPPATHLSTQLVEYLCDVPFTSAGRTLIKSTGQFCGQLLPFFCTNLSGVVQVSFVSNQDESHILGLFDLIQNVFKWQHFLKTSSISNVIDQHEAFPPSHVSFPLDGVFLMARKNSSQETWIILVCRCCCC